MDKGHFEHLLMRQIKNIKNRITILLIKIGLLKKMNKVY